MILGPGAAQMLPGFSIYEQNAICSGVCSRHMGAPDGFFFTGLVQS